MNHFKSFVAYITSTYRYLNKYLAFVGVAYYLFISFRLIFTLTTLEFEYNFFNENFIKYYYKKARKKNPKKKYYCITLYLILELK